MISSSSFIFVFISSCIFFGESVQPPQKFRVEPSNVETSEGSEVTLRCEIDNLSGEVQWTRDGEALGVASEFNTDLLYPRYSYIGSRNKGIANLRIRNVSLEDDAEFQCQVGQKVIGDIVIPPIRVSAYLTVTIPPSSVQIMDYANDSEVNVRENEELRLKCVVRNSRPPAKIIWYREKSEIKLGVDEGANECRTLNRSRPVEVCDVSSTVTLRPRAAEQPMNYSCVARHESLSPENILFATVRLSILYAPGPPYIEDKSEDATYMYAEGNQAELICRSSGGNPKAQLKWLRNGIEVSKEMIYKINGKTSESSLNLVLTPEDNNANYTCEASNAATVQPLTATVQLKVAFGPEKIEINGIDDARAGDNVTLICKTSPSNPTTTVQWVVGEQLTIESSSKLLPAPGSATITLSTLYVLVPANKKELTVYCYANNPKDPKNVHAIKTINIQYPPGAPVIRGYTKGGFISDGTHQTLSCTSSGGNPLANLTWYKNDKIIEPVMRKRDRMSSFADITIEVNKTDNGAVYKCQAWNPTVIAPLSDFVKLKVYFAPENASISIKPTEPLTVGTITALSCTSSTSNPSGEISWYRNGIAISESNTTTNYEPDLFGGNRSHSQLLLNVTADMNGNTFTCRSTNAVLQRSINAATKLHVLYKPIFKKINYNPNYSVLEGESFSVNFEAEANPANIEYHWVFASRSLNDLRGPTLYLEKVKRSDSGVYTCQAQNSEGLDFLSFHLDVKYEAVITNISRIVTVKNGTDAEMWCVVSGNPMEADYVFWAKPNTTDFTSRRIEHFEDTSNTKVMKLPRITMKDMGLYYCIVNNEIGVEKNASTFLIVEHAPVIERRAEAIKVASNISLPARFECRGSAAPKLEFVWYKRDVLLNRTVKYSIDSEQIDELNYRSILIVKQVSQTDYGEYYCFMQNSLGTAKVSFELINNSKPDPPTNVTVTNATHNSVALSWALEFDGGIPTNFRIRYFCESKAEDKRSKDVGNLTRTVVTGLYPGMTYVFEVSAFNTLGESGYSAIEANTTSVTMSTGSQRMPIENEGFILFVAAVIVGLLLLLNVLMLLVCAWRRSKKNEKNLTKMNHKSVEMFATASKTSNDVSSGTISSMQSIKLNEDDSYGPMNLVPDDINYPFLEKNQCVGVTRSDSKNNNLYQRTQDVYSSIGHIHLLSPPMPPFEFSYSDTSHHTATLPNRRRMSQISDAASCLMNGSPTPSIPPPMSTISTQAYRSLQYNNYLHL